MMLKSASGLSGTPPSCWYAQRRSSGNRRQQKLRDRCFGAAERNSSGGLRPCVSLLLCDMAADVDCRRWSLVVREKKHGSKPETEVLWILRVEILCENGAESSVQSAWSPNCQPSPLWAWRQIHLINSLKALCRTAWSQSPVTFGFDLEMRHHPLRRTAGSQLQPLMPSTGRQKYEKHNRFHKHNQRI